VVRRAEGGEGVEEKVVGWGGGDSKGRGGMVRRMVGVEGKGEVGAGCRGVEFCWEGVGGVECLCGGGFGRGVAHTERVWEGWGGKGGVAGGTSSGKRRGCYLGRGEGSHFSQEVL